MATSFKLSFLGGDVSHNDVGKESRKSKPGQPRLPNGPFLIRMLIRHRRKSRPGHPRLPNVFFLIKMLTGIQGNLGLASQRS